MVVQALLRDCRECRSIMLCAELVATVDHQLSAAVRVPPLPKPPYLYKCILAEAVLDSAKVQHKNRRQALELHCWLASLQQVPRPPLSCWVQRMVQAHAHGIISQGMTDQL